MEATINTSPSIKILPNILMRSLSPFPVYRKITLRIYDKTLV